MAPAFFIFCILNFMRKDRAATVSWLHGMSTETSLMQLKKTAQPKITRLCCLLTENLSLD